MKRFLFLILLCGCEKSPDPNALPQIGRVYYSIHVKNFEVVPIYYDDSPGSRRFVLYSNLNSTWMPRAWMSLTNLNQDFRLKK